VVGIAGNFHPQFAVELGETVVEKSQHLPKAPADSPTDFRRELGRELPWKTPRRRVSKTKTHLLLLRPKILLHLLLLWLPVSTRCYCLWPKISRTSLSSPSSIRICHLRQRSEEIWVSDQTWLLGG
jgi:hypothetical protein